MRVQTHGFSSSTSQLPWFVPPHGPFRSPLGQRVTGQIPPDHSRTHSPHVEHFSWKCMWRCEFPRKRLSLVGETGRSVASTAACTPAPQLITNTTSARATCSLCLRKCRLASSSWQGAYTTVDPVILWPSSVSMRPSSSTSHSPPVLHCVA